MNKTRNALFGILVFVILFSNLQTVNSTLWDLLIDVNLEKNPLTVEEFPVVVGTITDHAGKPVSGAEVKIRLGAGSIITSTDILGKFVGKFSDFDGIPAKYVVNVYATIDKKVGLKSVDFQVRGELSVSSYTETLLSTDEAIKYLQASEEDFEYDPLGLTLYYYYQDLQAQFFEEQKLQAEIEEQQKLLDEQREASLQLAEEIIEEANPGAGTYSGWKYDRFVSNLDPLVKDIIVNQLNYTVSVFAEAQIAMEEVLANGGTIEEARQAYYEKATIPRELMDALTLVNQSDNNENDTNSDIEMMSESYQNSTENKTLEEDTSLILNVNGTLIDVGKLGSVIYLNVNGTIIELYVNSTEINQVTNSSQS